MAQRTLQVSFSKWAQGHMASADRDVCVVAGAASDAARVHRLLMCHHLVRADEKPVVLTTWAAALHPPCTTCACDEEWYFEGPVGVAESLWARFSRPPYVIVSFDDGNDDDAVGMHSDLLCEALRGPNVSEFGFAEVHLLDMVNHMCAFDWPVPCAACFDASQPDNAAVLAERVSNPSCRRFLNQRPRFPLAT